MHNGSPSPPYRTQHTTPQVAVFARVTDGPSGSERWAFLAHKSPHSHDVRALAAAPRGGGGDDELLLSGGLDGTLVAYPATRILEVGAVGRGQWGRPLGAGTCCMQHVHTGSLNAICAGLQLPRRSAGVKFLLILCTLPLSRRSTPCG